MKFLKKFIRAYREASIRHEYDLWADTDDGWTDEDSNSTLQFFLSETGQRLNARLRNFVFQTATKAVRNPSNNAYHSGIANGVCLIVDALQQHYLARQPRKVGTSEGEEQSSVASELALQ